MTRRTQEERRTETIARLIEATIDSLCERGFAATSTQAICTRAGLSQGALFNHFGKRIDLIVATTESICRIHIERLARVTADQPALTTQSLLHLVDFIRASARTREHIAWHEVMVAARTDDELRDRVAPLLGAFEQALLDAGAQLFGRRDETFDTIVLSIMHMFDSEAVTTAVYPNPAVEAARTRWVAELLRAELDAG